ERVGRPRARRQRMGVDRHAVRAVPRLRRVHRAIPRIFGRFLRRQALRAEGRVLGHGGAAHAEELPQLVPGALSVRLREVPLRALIPFEVLALARGAEPWGTLTYSPLCCISFATTPVHPVWWLAPMPAPVSPWKYS